MTYFVDEIQNSTSTNYSFDTQAEAESKYHYILSFAAVSDVEKHGAVMYDNDGNFIASRIFKHEQQE